MSLGITSRDKQQPLTGTISFGERFVKSEQFDRVFHEGMALVERTAAYLENEGRAAARKLAPPLSVVYATESMRLTTRLLELASWLLIRRSINVGEITTEEAARKRSRLKLGGSGRPSHNSQFDNLPAGLRSLISESFQLHDRIVQIDRAVEMNVSVSNPVDAQNPVARQLTLIKSAFGGAETVAAESGIAAN